MKTSRRVNWAKKSERQPQLVLCAGCGKPTQTSKTLQGADGRRYCLPCFESEFIVCPHCGDIVWRDNAMRGADNELYCESCFDELFTICAQCGKAIYREDAVTVHTCGHADSVYDSPEDWCYDCADAEAVKCVCCGDYFDSDFDGNETVDGWCCDGCIDDHYCRCEHCGEFISSEVIEYNDDDEGLCSSCYERWQEGRVIHKYHSCDYRPLNWHGGSEEARQQTLFVGVELELCDGGTDTENARAIVEATGYEVDESFVVERDGSLRDGFEIISSTATVDFHINEYGWDELMDKAIQLGYTSHDSGCAGLHVHLDREYFTDATCSVEHVITILAVNNADWLKKFSRRRDFSYCKFPKDVVPFKGITFGCTSADEVPESELMLIEVANGFHADRYSCVNFRNSETIELRFSRGTLKFSTFVAIMQLTQMLADFTKRLTYAKACNICLRHFKLLAKLRGYEAFLNYLVERGID